MGKMENIWGGLSTPEGREVRLGEKVERQPLPPHDCGGTGRTERGLGSDYHLSESPVAGEESGAGSDWLESATGVIAFLISRSMSSTL